MSKKKLSCSASRWAQKQGAEAGQYVASYDWNELISGPDVLVLGTRSRDETRIGSFSGALDPKIEQFSDFAAPISVTTTLFAVPPVQSTGKQGQAAWH